MCALTAFEPELFMTEEEYLAMEDAAETKHEFVDGHVYDWPGYDYDAEGMVGARRAHNRLQMNFLLAVGPAARAAGCEPFGSDMRLRIRLPHTRRYYYPDAMVLCDQELRAAEGDDEMHVTRPCIVAEVLSQRSVRIDHTEKLLAYQAMTSVQAYLIIHQQQQRVEFYRRGEDATWQAAAMLEPGDTMRLPCIEADLRVADLYA
jgi:Uma2 family endonuclease